jgi:hypothetical protein|nr:MAG TPA: FIBRITIN T4, STRUCTURAL PROTEIN, CHAPERONE.85A [Caudoviricetes sp.]
MAAGDIILSDGTTITPEDLQKIAAAVEDLIASTAKDPGQYEEVDSLVGISSLPTFQQSGNTFKTVRATIKALQGVDGKTPQFKIGTVSEGDSPSVTLTPGGADGSGNPIYNINLVLAKGNPGDPGTDGKTPKFEVGEIVTLEPGQPATVQISFKENDVDGSPIYEISMSLPKGSKGDAGDSGKTPILESVNATSGETPSGSFTKNGVDEEGNPKYILNLTTPKGKDGQPAVFEQGTTTTLDPSEEARVEVVENGETPEGNPKYILNFFIPRGQTGPSGAGTGNVLVDAAGLISGKKYLFVPDSDNSSSGTFMEYAEPVIPTKTSDLTNNSGFITKAVNDLTNYYLKSETYTKEEVQSLISAVNSVTLQKVDSLPEPGESNVIYLVPKSGSGNDIYDEYIFIDGKPEHIGSTQVDLSNYVQEAPKDGKTYGRNNGAWSEIVASNQYLDYNSLFPDNGGTMSDENYQKIVDAKNNAVCLILIGSDLYYMRITEKDDEYLITIDGSTLDVPEIDYAVNAFNIGYVAIRIIKTIKEYINYYASLSLKVTGSGTKYLSDNGEYLTPPTATSATAGYMSAEDKNRVDDAIVPTSITKVSSLVSLPVGNYNILATMSSATAISFASTPKEGAEFMINVYNSGSSDFTINFPSTSTWKSNEASVTCKAGNFTPISVQYLNGYYVVVVN